MQATPQRQPHQKLLLEDFQVATTYPASILSRLSSVQLLSKVMKVLFLAAYANTQPTRMLHFP